MGSVEGGSFVFRDRKIHGRATGLRLTCVSVCPRTGRTGFSLGVRKSECKTVSGADEGPQGPYGRFEFSGDRGEILGGHILSLGIGEANFQSRHPLRERHRPD